MSDRLIEELTTALIRENGLVVRSTSRVRDATAIGGDIEAIGTRLGGRHVLDGGIQRGSGKARITLRLVRVSDAIATWAGSR